MGYDPGAVRVRARRFLPYVLGFSVIAALLGTASAVRDEVTLGAIGHEAAHVHPPIDNRNHLYVLDGWGGIHPVGASPALASTASWPTKDIAYSLALFPDGTGGYVMDGWGGLHPVGGAPTMDSGVYWPHWIGAREIVLAPWSSHRAPAGYLLDADGGIHAFGGAPAVTPSAQWPGQDMADSMVSWTAASAASPGGWVLDRHGEVHAWGSAPPLAASQTWPSWDIARGLAGAGSGGGSTERVILDAQPISDGWGAYYNQRDSRWASANVGAATFPVWKIGCLISDLAMVFAHFGFASVTPATIAAHPGWFNGSGAMFNSALNIPGHRTVVMRSPDPAWIRAQVGAGHPVIVGMNLPTGGTHFVTLTGLNGASDYWTNDPGEQNAMHVAFSGDWFDRGPIYEAFAFL